MLNLWTDLNQKILNKFIYILIYMEFLEEFRETYKNKTISYDDFTFILN